MIKIFIKQFCSQLLERVRIMQHNRKIKQLKKKLNDKELEDLIKTIKFNFFHKEVSAKTVSQLLVKKSKSEFVKYSEILTILVNSKHYTIVTICLPSDFPYIENHSRLIGHYEESIENCFKIIWWNKNKEVIEEKIFSDFKDYLICRLQLEEKVHKHSCKEIFNEIFEI
ncbi:MAG: hypothetical protein IKU78_05165 [Paludibacteraceae bacterium]|nr:hypothetical protein [Paludibacteraceae bacterium]